MSCSVLFGLSLLCPSPYYATNTKRNNPVQVLELCTFVKPNPSAVRISVLFITPFFPYYGRQNQIPLVLSSQRSH
jgi:hypothetical protein